MPAAYIYLVLAVVAETIGTTALQASQQFTRLWPSLLVIASYAVSFYLLSITLKFMPIGIMYAIWSGLGIVLIAGIAFLVYGQKLDIPAIIGLGLILAGILVIHLFSSTSFH
jgi:small multidrug resistance pump